MLSILLALYVGAFLLGSIPVGYLVAKARGIDIRTVGSGNIGATNVTRALGHKTGYAVFLVDVLKGLIPGLVARVLFPPDIWSYNDAPPNWFFWGWPVQILWFLAGIAAFLGHMFCPWLGFKGGKGIATGLGALLAAAPTTALCSFGVFLAFLFLTHYVSLSSLIAAVALPIFGLTLPGEPRELVAFYVPLSLLIFYKHRDNIKRLKAGTESKFSFRSKDAPGREHIPGLQETEEFKPGHEDIPGLQHGYIAGLPETEKGDS
ncbi:MAG TPA: glycerol-3-phosphate 1-O-acyltransferase PlsY [Fimbriimonas sp.]|nr:glycerol-3-phosphate 1-O-acyltransferase PlsY [Fimbriimonas sp.]